jgi:L-ascorbate metabolism protein UlaG (beta-lactamase superfamily)
MRIRWYGQSAFLLSAERSVFIDPFGVPGEQLAARGIEFRYPPIEGVTPDLVLVTHDHFDHNAVEAVGGAPAVLRSTAGRLESPIGEVVAVASEHDDVAGTARGPNTIFCFTLDGLRCCHLGDFGQPSLREEQRAAIGAVDVLMLPVGGGPTIGGPAAAELARAIGAPLIVPMHYRTPAVNFLEPPDAFLDAVGARVERLGAREVEARDLLDGGEPVAALLSPP